MTEKLDTLKIKENQLKARIEMAQAREKNERRKKDTRRKILIGAFFLEHYTKQNKMDLLRQRLDKYLTRNSDRHLFDLPPIDNTPTNKQ